jgi:hypothetical protein
MSQSKRITTIYESWISICIYRFTSIRTKDIDHNVNDSIYNTVVMRQMCCGYPRQSPNRDDLKVLGVNGCRDMADDRGKELSKEQVEGFQRRLHQGRPPPWLRYIPYLTGLFS